MLSSYQEFEEILRKPSDEIQLGTFERKIRSIAKGDFFMRYTTIQSWFMRSSHVNKLKFLATLFETVKRHNPTAAWCAILDENTIDKAMTYADTLKDHQFHYDKVLLDSNRTCDAEALHRAMTDDMQWFQNVDEDLQEGIFLALLSLAGGGVIKNLRGYLKTFHPSPPVIPATSSSEVVEASLSREVLGSVVNSRTYVEPLNEKNPVDLIVLNKRNEWSRLMANYSAEVTRKENADKKSKSSKKSSRAESSKSHVKSAGEEIDYLQVLPIKIVKEIFNYLDKHTLTRVKAVNPYWEYAVDSLSKDVKARQVLDKAIAKLEKDLPENYKACSAPPCKPEHHNPAISPKGTVSRRIRKKLDLEGMAVEESLITRAIEGMAERYLLPLHGECKSFPRRLVPMCEDNLYKSIPCVVYEGGMMEKCISDLEEISSEINIQNKKSSIKVDSPVASSEDVRDGGEFSPAVNLI